MIIISYSEIDLYGNNHIEFPAKAGIQEADSTGAPFSPGFRFFVSIYNDLTLADYFNEEVRHLFLMLDEHRFDPGKTLHTNGPAQ